MKASDALRIAMRTDHPSAWALAKRMAEVEIGRFGLAVVIGLEAHANEKRAFSGGYVIDLRH